MSTRVDAEEIESTRSEKFLAVVLTAFLLIGTIWFYVKAEDWFDGREDYSYYDEEPVYADEDPWLAIDEAQQKVDREETDVDQAKVALDIALRQQAGVAEAQAQWEQEQNELIAAQDELAKAQEAANEFDKKMMEEEKERFGPPTEARQWLIAGVRFGFIVTWLVGSLVLLARLRSRHSRFLALGFAGVAAGAITACVFAADYIFEYVNPLDLGPIVLSAIGAGATIVAFVFLQRFLARRIPGRRVRKGECPFCGFPIREDALVHGRDHCEGCGRDVIANCAACDKPRRVGSPHCSACGAA